MTDAQRRIDRLLLALQRELSYPPALQSPTIIGIYRALLADAQRALAA